MAPISASPTLRAARIVVDYLLLVHTSGNARRVAGRLPRENPPSQWLFLGEDYARQLEWQSALESVADRVDSGPMLREAAARLRRPFLERITELGRRYDSLAWWASRISERNTMSSPLFLHCCYLEVGRRALVDLPGALCVISQSRAVLDSLADEASGHGIRVLRVGRPLPGSRRAARLARTAVRVARFGLRSMLTRLAVPHFHAPAASPRVLVRTWVDESCFGPDGTFRDRYFAGLPEFLERRGCAVALIPVLYNVRRSHRSAWAWLLANRLPFIPPARYLRLSDYLFALRVAHRQASLPTGQVALDGVDVSRVLDEERARAAFDGGVLEACASFRLPRRLAEAGIAPAVFIDSFENMIDEKTLNLGFRRYLPDTRLVGYQHAGLSPLLLSNFVTHGESTFAPMPDRVVCNGNVFRQILVDEGLPLERTVVGPALRFQHLWSAESAPSAEGGLVLVALPLELGAAVELLVKVHEALGDVPTLRVILKPHPMSSPSNVFAGADVSTLPPHFEVVAGGMDEWLPRAAVVLALATNVIYEALAAGVPVLVVGRDSALDLNPLGWFEEMDEVFSRPQEIRTETLRLLALSAEELAAHRRRSVEILQRSFAPATDETMLAFVDGFVPLTDPR